MNLGWPIAPSAMLAAGIAAAALLGLAYVLKLRRRAFEVPFATLWQRVLQDRESSSLWRRLKRLLSLAVQLVIAALVLGAALDPSLGHTRDEGRSVVVIVDTSASMQAQDGPEDGTRMDAAKQAAREFMERLGSTDQAMLVAMDAESTAVTRFGNDPAVLASALDHLAASDTPADLPAALGAAADALRGRTDPLIVLVGDGAYPEAATGRATWEGEPGLSDVDLGGIEVTFVPVGQKARNIGIVGFNVRRYIRNKLAYEAVVSLASFSPEAEDVELAVYADADPVFVETLRLEPGQRITRAVPDLGGEGRVLRARITPAAGPDAFALDDEAVALLPIEKPRRLLLVSRDNLYLEGVLLLDESLTVDKLLPAHYTDLAARTYDIVVFDAWGPAAPPEVPAVLYFGPPREQSPVPVARVLQRPYVTDVNEEHPVTRWVTLADVNFDDSLVFRPEPGDTTLVSSVRAPMAVARDAGGTKLVVLGFDLEDTDLMLRAAFPILMVNILDWFTGQGAQFSTTYPAGQSWTIPVPGAPEAASYVVTRPDGTSTTLAARDQTLRLRGKQVGVHEIAGPTGQSRIAANLASPDESRITAATELTLGGRAVAAPPRLAPSTSWHLWRWLVLAAVAILALEWVTYHRRITV